MLTRARLNKKARPKKVIVVSDAKPAFVYATTTLYIYRTIVLKKGILKINALKNTNILCTSNQCSDKLIFSLLQKSSIKINYLEH
jgi:hypothetical protein